MASRSTGAGGRVVAERMAGAAVRLLESLDAGQRSAACWPFPSDDERQLWFYTPTDHGGLPLAAMSSAQHQLTMALLATGLSEAGYVTAATIMGLENVLDRVEGWSVAFDRERGRDPLLYWVAVFGNPGGVGAGSGPGTRPWGWRFGGHHISLSYTIVNGEVVSTTPCFFGADPAAAPLLGPHLHRPLAGVEDLGRELVRALDADQQAAAVVSTVPPTDLITGNRTALAEGDHMLPLPLIWRGRFERELDTRLGQMQETASATLGLTADHLDTLAFSFTPKGVPVDRLRSDHHEILRALLDCYLDRIPPELADAEKAKLDDDGLSALSFLWAGSTEPGRPHYYRIQGSELLVEYDNTQRDANHVHAVWRDLPGDFGRDSLAQHYSDAH